MTDLLFRSDPYLQDAPARALGHTAEGAILIDRSIFCPADGVQPGDSGWIVWAGGRIAVATTVRAGDGLIGLVPAEPVALPEAGAELRQVLDWNRRYRHMRMHTALHLLSVVIALPVSGGQIGSERSRLDFDMSDPPQDAAAIELALNALSERDLPVREVWIGAAELAARPDLVRTMAVRPPTGQGPVRLIQIGAGPDHIDLQPCGGTHVARTGEVGRVELGRIEKKGHQNRRVALTFAD